MSGDSDLYALADAAGINADWVDASGDPKRVGPDSLRAVLAALDLPAGSDGELKDSIRRVQEDQSRLPRLVTVEAGQPVHVGRGRLCQSARLELEGGDTRDVQLQEGKQGWVLTAPDRTGYHRLECGGEQMTIAVAPRSGVHVADLAPGRRIWALAAQIYSLRPENGGTDAGYGTFGDLADFARKAAAGGADAVAVSPVHALFAASPERYSPYSPSTRLFLNALYADPAAALGRGFAPDLAPPAPAGGDLIDWESAGSARLAWLRALYERFRNDGQGPGAQAFREFRETGGDLLEGHARFEALHAHFKRERGAADWLSWPDPYRQSGGREVERFAAENAHEVGFHAFLQWLASTSLDAAQQAARDAGMAVGLIADLAVGMDRGGSHGWSRPHELLMRLSVGAPPDLLGPQGQDWGLTGFSPRGLVSGGFAPFIETLRAAMRHAGGVRIDHAMSMQRLWVIPTGAQPLEGAYLRYPLDDLVRLVALESERNRALVIAEDLGTVPEGFREKIAAAGILGMRVLFFERGKDGRFLPPQDYPSNAAALTTTHDLATVAGWWEGREIEWRERVGWLDDDGKGQQLDERSQDRELLWQAMREAKLAEGEQPPVHDSWPVADAACRYVARTPAPLAVVPVEDVAAIVEQPNLPGTTGEHPNWRRRLPPHVLDERHAQRRMEMITKERADG
jgi:4-alpha-glucanotransferase